MPKLSSEPTLSGMERDRSYYLQRIVERSPSLLAYWDAGLRCRYANPAYARWFGVDPERLLGGTIHDLLGPELFALNRGYIEGALAGREQLFERVVKGKDGVNRHSLARYQPDIVDGVVQGFVAEVTETTLLKQAEASLSASESRFKALAESSPLGIYEIDAKGLRTYVNSRYRQIFGAGADEDLGSDVARHLHPADRDVVMAAWHRSVERAEPFDREFRILRADGQVRTVHSRRQPIRSPDGGLAGFVGAVEDVTEQRATQSRLRASEALLDRTGRLARIGGWAVDLRTSEISWSEQTRRIHELPPGYKPTMSAALDFYAPEARPLIKAALDDAVANGGTWDLELRFITATGRELWVRSLGEVEYEAGRPVRLIGAFQDITERRQQRLDLEMEQRARAQGERHARELDRLLRERNEMLDVMAHEVRQPLNNASAALQSAAEVLVESGATAASSRLLRAQNVMGSVLSSIDNTLAVASLLARSGPIQQVDTDVDMLLQLTIVDLPSEERDRISIERAPGNWTAAMDVSLMRLALRNLLANALRYSPPRSPVVVRLVDSDEPLALLIEVIDAGPGIPPEMLPRLFQREPHKNRMAAPKGQGLGLGLYIVRRVMELHRGQVELARSGPGGVTMRLVLIQPADDPAA